MQHELDLFSINGSCGGSQDWMKNLWMKLGGCAALAAVDSCIFFARHHHLESLCPYDPSTLTKALYNDFAEEMRPYLSPRRNGVNRLELYTEGFSAYLRDRNCSSLRMDTLPMGTALEIAEESIAHQIDSGFLVPILHLTPKAPAARYYKWHWFLLCGYRRSESSFQVKAVTYDNAQWLDLSILWNENDSDNGGLVLYSLDTPEPKSRIVKVAAAIICDRLALPTRVFATARGYGAQKGRWEFPGGKLEPGECAEEALKREIREELDVEIEIGRHLTTVEYDYPDFHLSMDCYTAVLANDKEPVLKEALEARWLNEESLNTVDWLPADRILLDIIFAEMISAETILARIEAEEREEGLKT